MHNLLSGTVEFSFIKGVYNVRGEKSSFEIFKLFGLLNDNVSMKCGIHGVLSCRFILLRIAFSKAETLSMG